MSRNKRYEPKPLSVVMQRMTPISSFAKAPRVTIPVFLEVLSALHFARFVPSPIEDCGGLMLVAPSGSLKSSLLSYLQRAYPESCVCDSNWHYGKLMKMKQAFYNGGIRSLVIPELSSLHAGDPRTGGRMEAMLMQMAGEGAAATNAADSRFSRYPMRAAIFGAMTPEFAEQKHQGWEQGFHRRFLWAYLAMENDEVLMDYLNSGSQANLDVVPLIEPSQHHIPDLLDFTDKQFVRKLITPQKDFGPNHLRYVLLCRAASVLKWSYERTDWRKDWKKTLSEFAKCLGSEAALLVIPEEPVTAKFKKDQELSQIAAARKGIPEKKVSRKKKLKHKKEGANGAAKQEPELKTAPGADEDRELSPQAAGITEQRDGDGVDKPTQKEGNALSNL